MPHAIKDAIPSQAIDEALGRVLASRAFRGAARKRRFLEFVVRQTQDGHADRIKAFSIAMDVFDRDEGFDPVLDPVVRIHAGRLRQSLDQYYANEGAADPIRITIPKGCYVPHFDTRPDACAKAADCGSPGPGEPDCRPAEDDANPVPPTPTAIVVQSFCSGVLRATARWQLVTAAGLVILAALVSIAPSWIRLSEARGHSEEPASVARQGSSLLVAPVTNDTGDPTLDRIADSFTEALAGALTRSGTLLVFGMDPHVRDDAGTALPKPGRSPAFDYVLRGSITRLGEQVEITATLMDTRDGRYLWADTMRGGAASSSMIDLWQDIAARVAGALTRPNGTTLSAKMPAAARTPTAHGFFLTDPSG